MNAESCAPSAAFLEDLVDRYSENLMRAAFSLGFSEVDAEELVQATFVAFLDGGARFEKRSRILTYLFGILYNKARETRRFQHRHESIEAAVDQCFDDHFDHERHWNKETEAQMSDVERRAQSSAIGEALSDCLEGLSALMRMVFTMKDVEGCEAEAISLALGLSPSNVGVTLFRARHKLRDCLTAKGIAIV